MQNNYVSNFLKIAYVLKPQPFKIFTDFLFSFSGPLSQLAMDFSAIYKKKVRISNVSLFGNGSHDYILEITPYLRLIRFSHSCQVQETAHIS